MPDMNQITPPDWPQRELVESELETNMLVEAAAGTGKTTKIVDRMVALVGSGKCRLENMAAVTFTRKAASELRTRFQLELERRARPESSGQGADSDIRLPVRGWSNSIVCACSACRVMSGPSATSGRPSSWLR